MACRVEQWRAIRPLRRETVERYTSPTMKAKPGDDRRELVPLALAAATIVVGIAIRFVLSETPLWLDEAQTLAVIGDGFGSIDDFLREDGHPPLYYWILQWWTTLVGDGDAATRSLSLIFGLGCLPLIAVVANRLGGRSVVAPALALAASSPFLVRYSTEVRMYSLVVLLSLVWWLVSTSALTRPTALRLVGVTIATASLLLTHYWSAFLIGSGLCLAAVAWHRRSHERRAVARVVVAGAAGGLVFLAWLPAFLTQLRHTGTPWAVNRNPVSSLVTGLADLAGGREEGHAIALFGLLLVLLVVGGFGRGYDRWQIHLDLRLRAEPSPLIGLVIIAVAGGLGTAALLGLAFAPRYFSIIAAFVIVVAARGIAQIGDPLVRASVLAAAVGLGLLGAVDQVLDDRSQGRIIAEAIATGDAVTDVVVACPDQLGPATARYLPTTTEIVGYPLLEPGHRVDWTDYVDRNASASPTAVAEAIVTRWPGADVWLVFSGGYRTFDDQCERLAGELAARRPGSQALVHADADVFEPMGLIRFPAPTS